MKKLVTTRTEEIDALADIAPVAELSTVSASLFEGN